MDKRSFTCCFTGHRDLPAGQEEEIWRRVHTCLEPLLEEGVRYFGVGGALGFDTLVAEKLLALRESRPNKIRIILVQSFPGYQSRWTPTPCVMHRSRACGCGTWPSPAKGADCALPNRVEFSIIG